MVNKIMYIEQKGTAQPGSARIGRMVVDSFTRVVTYQGKKYQPRVDRQAHANYYEIGSGEWYWISHCQKNGSDSLHSQLVQIDADIQSEYWEGIRRLPEMTATTSFQSPGKHR